MTASRKLYRQLACDFGRAFAEADVEDLRDDTASLLENDPHGTMRMAQLMRDIAETLSRDNPRFSYQVFWDAVAEERVKIRDEILARSDGALRWKK